MVAHVGELERFLVNRLVEAVGIHEVVTHVLPSHSSRQHVGHLKEEAGVMSGMRTSYRRQYCGQCWKSGMFNSWTWTFSVPDPRSELFPSLIPDQIFSIPDPGSASKNLSILTQKNVSKLSEIWFRSSSRIRIGILIFYPSRIPSSGVKSTGSATLHWLGIRRHILIW